VTIEENIGNYFLFYNSERPHSALDYRTPEEVYYGGRRPKTMGYNMSPGQMETKLKYG
jgi:hypothetical protein